MDLTALNKYFYKYDLQFKQSRGKISITNGQSEYKLGNSIKDKKIKILIEQLGGKSVSKSRSKSVSKSKVQTTDAFETAKFKKIETWYDEDKERECIDTFRGRPVTNPKDSFFNQMYYSASDNQDFERYGILPLQLLFGNKTKNNKINLTKNVFSKLESDIKISDYYKPFSIKNIKESFKYLYEKFQKGILVAIKDNQLVVFLPFYNKQFANDYSKYLYFDDDDKKNMEELDKLNKKESTSKLNYSDNKRLGELIGLTKKRLSDFYRSKGDKPFRFMNDRRRWLANDCGFVNHNPQKQDQSHGANEYHYLFTELLKNRKVDDVIFFLSYRDLPILKEDGTHPYEKLHEGSNVKLDSKWAKTDLVPICTPSTGDGFATIPLITDETILRISNKRFPKKCIGAYTTDALKGLEKKWVNKNDIAFFRGGATGCGITVETNKRLKLAEIASNHRDLFDAGITGWNAKIKKTASGELDIINPHTLPFGLIEQKNNVEKSKCKYIINVEGHSAAYRLNFELGLGSVILMVESKFYLWYHFLLKPNIHYIPIKGDLSDLVEKVEWCKGHDTECKKIADNAMKLYNTYLDKEGCLDYMQMLFHKMNRLLLPGMRQNTLSPPSKTKKQNIAVITIFRDNGNGEREVQRKQFIDIMSQLLEPICNFKIYIIEQSDDGEKFNIGKLKNIGFEIASKDKKDKKHDNYIFTDIDIIPDSDLIEYYIKPVKGFMELAVRGSRYRNVDNKKKKQTFPFLGSLLSCDEQSFKKINGYPNHYWGWGNEDIDITLRIFEKGIKIYTPKNGEILDMEVDKNGHLISARKKLEKLKNKDNKNDNKKSKTLVFKKYMDKSGLGNLQYKLITKTEISGSVTQFKVDLQKSKDIKINIPNKTSSTKQEYKNMTREYWQNKLLI
jgi:hypothetical protein